MRPTPSQAVDRVKGWCDVHRPVAVVMCRHGDVWLVYPNALELVSLTRDENAERVLVAPMDACEDTP